jgi:hypothetical protein
MNDAVIGPRRPAPARPNLVWVIIVLGLFGVAVLLAGLAPEVSPREPGFPGAAEPPADWRGGAPAAAPLLH